MRKPCGCECAQECPLAEREQCTHCHNAHNSAYSGRCGKGDRMECGLEGALAGGAQNTCCHNAHNSAYSGRCGKGGWWKYSRNAIRAMVMLPYGTSYMAFRVM